MDGANSFLAYQRASVENRKSVMMHHLNALKKNRATFEYLTDLAKNVAKQISLVQERPCSYTTLLRNVEYKVLLLEFMLVRHCAGALKVSEPWAQTRIHTLELDLGNSRRENERLQAYISHLEGAGGANQELISESRSSDEHEADFVRMSNEKALVCKGLLLVLEHFQGLVSPV
jgi:hypothetical protein